MEQKLTLLKKQYNRYRQAVIGLLGIMVVALLLAIFSTPIATLCLLGVAVIYHFSYVRRLQVAYTHALARENVLCTLGEVLGTDDFQEKCGGTLTREAISAAQLMPFKDGDGGCLLRQGISGERNGMRVSLCDATLMQGFQLVENGKPRIHFTAGVWMQVILPEDTGMDWRILNRDAMPSPVRLKYFETLLHLEEQECPQDEMLLYATTDGAALPGKAVWQRIRQLTEYTTGKPAISLRGNVLSVFIGSRFVSLPVSVKNEPSAAQLGLNPLPELDHILKLAEALCKKE